MASLAVRVEYPDGTKTLSDGMRISLDERGFSTSKVAEALFLEMNLYSNRGNVLFVVLDNDRMARL